MKMQALMVMTLFTLSQLALAGVESRIGYDATAQGQIDWHKHASHFLSKEGPPAMAGVPRDEFAVFETRRPTGVGSDYTGQGQFNWLHRSQIQ